MYWSLFHNIVLNLHLQEPSQNCTNNGRHLAEEFDFNGMYIITAEELDHNNIIKLCHLPPSLQKNVLSYIELRLSNLSNAMGDHSTSNVNSASGEHQIPFSRIFDCSNITCQQGFYCEEPEGSSAVCSPNCYTWTQFSRSTSIAIDFVILLAECIGVVSGVAIFIVAGMRWRKV